jgi:protein gp37
MNRTRIEWTQFTWNPIVGCKHGCWYCYAKKLRQRFKKIFPNGFEPTFHPERLMEPYESKKPSKIFVCSIADLFASWTPLEWRNQVLGSMQRCPVKHIFQLLTKNPENISPLNYYVGTETHHFDYPDNWWFGTTVTNTDGDWKNIEAIKKIPAKVRFVSFEPLLGPLPDNICLDGLQWIIIGKLTGSKRVKLDESWVNDIVTRAGLLGIPVFLKNNLHYPNPMQNFPQQEVS